MDRITFIAKTNLNNDGRILNQIKILQGKFPDSKIDFILLPDAPLSINLGKNVEIYSIKTFTRHNKILKFFTILEFTFKALMLLLNLKPSILHVEDTSAVLPAFIYRKIKGKKFTLIYDDHEMPNENESWDKKLYQLLEGEMMKISDYVIFANEERMEVIQSWQNLNSEKCSYFLNLPYFETAEIEVSDEIAIQLEEIDELKLNNIKFIIHQGVLGKERGRTRLAAFSKILPRDFKILLLGGSKNDFELFIEEFSIDKNNFFFVGSVNYLVLPKFWKKGIASIIMYLPTYINNRLCAPNRFYISVEKNLPVIVNEDNPVLSNFINKYKCGFFIESFLNGNCISDLNEYDSKQLEFSFEELRDKQIKEFVKLYCESANQIAFN